MPLRLHPFPADLAATCAGWASTDDETTMWCGQSAPVTAEQIQAWAADDSVQPYGLFHDERLIGYGELWVANDASEVELARLIVDPDERAHGIGRRLVAELAARARSVHPRVFLRIHPDNAAALRACAAVGFEPVDPGPAVDRDGPPPANVRLTLGRERVSVTRRVKARASAIFDLVSDPEGQVRLDGSGMLVAVAKQGSVATRLTAVGDAFEMEMDREPLGDLPMGRYRTRNVVTRIQEPRLLEWAVGSPDGQFLGHVYGYELTPASDDATDVVSYCDWAAVSPAVKARTRWPVVPADRLEATLANLERLLTTEARNE